MNLKNIMIHASYGVIYVFWGSMARSAETIHNINHSADLQEEGWW